MERRHLKKWTLFFVSVGVSFVTNAQNRIIGGDIVDISKRPYQAAVICNGSFNGGGVVIDIMR